MKNATSKSITAAIGLPDFFIIGASKTGTTSLYHYLKQHPQVYLPRVKEPHFFDDDLNFSEGLNAYMQTHYVAAPAGMLRGDLTVSYLRCHRKVLPRMISLFGDQSPLFIVVLRDPVARAWSHYRHRYSQGKETESFERALELEEARLRKSEFEWLGYFSEGLYAKQIEVWLKYFPKENFHFVLNDDLRSDPDGAMEKMLVFLGVDPTFKLDTRSKKNTAFVARNMLLMRFLNPPLIVKESITSLLASKKGGSVTSFFRKTVLGLREAVIYLRSKNIKPADEYPDIKEETIIWLRKQYVADVAKLEKIVGRDLSRWQ